MTETVALNYQETGDGPPVAILHGLYGSLRNWRSIATELSDQYRVISIDLRNHGDSPHIGPMGYSVMAADVASLLERLSISDASIIGHSMGGKVAMSLALSDPHFVKQLIVVDIAPDGYPNEYTLLIDSISQLDLNRIHRRSDASTALMDGIPNEEIRNFILQNLVFAAGSPPVWKINIEGIKHAIGDLIGPIPYSHTSSFEGPTVFLRGAVSDRVEAQHHETIGKLFPNSHITSIAGAGHWPQVQARGEFLARVRQILQAQ
jgi:esterase